jgi:hypothetical protein
MPPKGKKEGAEEAEPSRKVFIMNHGSCERNEARNRWSRQNDRVERRNKVRAGRGKKGNGEKYNEEEGSGRRGKKNEEGAREGY